MRLGMGKKQHKAAAAGAKYFAADRTGHAGPFVEFIDQRRRDLVG